MWRFAHITDPHLASQRDGEWNNRFLCTMMPEVMAVLKEDLARLKPELILATGDICSSQTREAMFEARDLMESLSVPYYPMGGNHDFVHEHSRAWFLEAYAHRLPRPKPYYSFDHKNLHFIVLDPWWMWGDGSLSPISEKTVAEKLDENLDHARWAVPPHQLSWLHDDLEDNREKPTCIATHYPPVGVPPRMQRPHFRNSGHLENGDLLNDVLSAYPQVRAVFCGHMHMHYIESVNGFIQVVTGALPEYPVEFRDVLVYDDRLEIRTMAISNPAFAARSLIPGREWTRGEPGDREAVISLRW
jgi:3',5'-cyclic AMP phosphodiesterase CpdA